MARKGWNKELFMRIIGAILVSFAVWRAINPQNIMAWWFIVVMSLGLVLLIHPHK
jgi:hypothetical protein